MALIFFYCVQQPVIPGDNEESQTELLWFHGSQVIYKENTSLLSF